MRKGWLFLATMAFLTAIIDMTTGADCVNLLLRFNKGNRFFEIVAKIAVFFLMAIDTAQAEKVYVLLVIESHNWATFIRSKENFLIGHSD